jgi:hypothetical protein
MFFVTHSLKIVADRENHGTDPEQALFTTDIN